MAGKQSGGTLHRALDQGIPSVKSVMSTGAGAIGREETLSSTEAGTLSNGNSDTIIPECTSLCLINRPLEQGRY